MRLIFIALFGAYLFLVGFSLVVLFASTDAMRGVLAMLVTMPWSLAFVAMSMTFLDKSKDHLVVMTICTLLGGGINAWILFSAASFFGKKKS